MRFEENPYHVYMPFEVEPEIERHKTIEKGVEDFLSGFRSLLSNKMEPYPEMPSENFDKPKDKKVKDERKKGKDTKKEVKNVPIEPDKPAVASVQAQLHAGDGMKKKGKYVKKATK